MTASSNTGQFLTVDINPSSGSGVSATLGSVAISNTGVGIWVKSGAGDTAWTDVAGSISNVTVTVPSHMTISGSPLSTSGTLAFDLATQTANRIFAGPTSGGAAVPTFRTQVLADLPQLTNGQLYIGSTGAAVVAAALTAGTGISVTNGAGTITVANTGVTSVALTVPSFLSVSGSPVSTTGTLAVTLATQTANTIFVGPTTGSAATPTFRTQVLADLPQLTNGQLYIGSTGASVVAATLTQGTGVSITNGAGTISIAATQQVGTGLKSKAGALSAASFTGTPRTATVTFSGAFASTAYSIQITGTDNRTFTWQSKAVGSFVINANSNAALSGHVDWIAMVTGESN